MFVFLIKDISSDDVLKTDARQHIAIVNCERPVVLIEKEIVMECDNVPDTFIMFFAMHCALDLQYRHELKTTIEFFQKVIMKLGAEPLSSKVTTLLEKIAKLKND
jgi:hypothetical protein